MGNLLPCGNLDCCHAMEAFKNTVEDPQIISMLNKLVGISNVYFGPDEVDKKIQAQYKLFQDVFKQAGLIK